MTYERHRGTDHYLMSQPSLDTAVLRAMHGVQNPVSRGYIARSAPVDSPSELDPVLERLIEQGKIRQGGTWGYCLTDEGRQR